MTDDTADTSTDERVEPDGGAVANAGQRHHETDYLDQEVNLLKPSTPFMRDHLKVVWGTFIAWLLIVWGPVVLTRLFPEAMTSTTVLGFPLHYFLVALGAPTGALVLAAIYAKARDNLDEKYGINPEPVEGETQAAEAAATDGGVDE